MKPFHGPLSCSCCRFIGTVTFNDKPRDVYLRGHEVYTVDGMGETGHSWNTQSGVPPAHLELELHMYNIALLRGLVK